MYFVIWNEYSKKRKLRKRVAWFHNLTEVQRFIDVVDAEKPPQVFTTSFVGAST